MTDLLNHTPPPPPAASAQGVSRYRSVWLVPGILLTMVGLLAMFQVVWGLLGGGWTAATVSERQTYSEQVSRIEIYTNSGDVEIVSTPGQDVLVERRSRVSSGAPRYDEGVSGDTLRLDARCPSIDWFLFGPICDIQYIVQVPAGVDVSAATDAGDMFVRDLDGDVELTSDAGDMDLSDLSGDLVAYTDAGNIQALGLTSAAVDVTSDAGDLDLDFQQPPDVVSAQTDAGDIEIALPDELDPDGDQVSYVVDVFTDAGDTVVDVAYDSQSSRTITALTDAGDVLIRYRGAAPGN